MFIGSRYVMYGLQFIRGIAIAAALGPSFYGVWSFLMLVQSYMIYGTLGVEFALNVMLSTGGDLDKERVGELLGTSLMIIGAMSAVVVALGIGFQVEVLSGFDDYQFNRYTLLLAVFVASSYYQQVMVNVYRFYGLLQSIVLVDLASTVLTIAPLFLFSSETLVSALMISFFVTSALGNVFYWVNSPVPAKLVWNRAMASGILALAIPLLFYNFAANLLSVLSRSVVSAYYSIESLGLFTFAFNISNSVFLGLSAISWAIFPSLLSGMREGLNDEAVVALTKRTNNLYGSAAFFVVVLASAGAPLLFLFLPKYWPSMEIVGVLLLSQGMGAVALGYGSLIYSRKKIFLMTMLNVAGSAAGISFAVLGASVGVQLPWIGVTMIVGQLVQLLLLVRVNTRLVRFEKTYAQMLAELFTPGRVAACACVILGISLGDPILWNIIAACSFVVLERRPIKAVYDFVVEHSRS